ncbi:MAG: CBS domain-containing protein, partial [Alphaproteobacteria bacterium]|nr:CBS domain-containing protein [Alphaproteobacteria bacterium]
EVMAVMTDRRIRHLPVMQDNHLIGIISIGDVVKYRIEAIEGEAAAMREYIATG